MFILLGVVVAAGALVLWRAHLNRRLNPPPPPPTKKRLPNRRPFEKRTAFSQPQSPRKAKNVQVRHTRRTYPTSDLPFLRLDPGNSLSRRRHRAPAGVASWFRSENHSPGRLLQRGMHLVGTASYGCPPALFGVHASPRTILQAPAVQHHLNTTGELDLTASSPLSTGHPFQNREPFSSEWTPTRVTGILSSLLRLAPRLADKPFGLREPFSGRAGSNKGVETGCSLPSTFPPPTRLKPLLAQRTILQQLCFNQERCWPPTSPIPSNFSPIGSRSWSENHSPGPFLSAHELDTARSGLAQGDAALCVNHSDPPGTYSFFPLKSVLCRC